LGKPGKSAFPFLTAFGFITELGNVRLDQFGAENQQTFITRMPARADKEDRLSQNSPERAGNFVNNSDDGLQLGL
jgi:hypothetical protein